MNKVSNNHFNLKSQLATLPALQSWYATQAKWSSIFSRYSNYKQMSLQKKHYRRDFPKLETVNQRSILQCKDPITMSNYRTSGIHTNSKFKWFISLKKESIMMKSILYLNRKYIFSWKGHSFYLKYRILLFFNIYLDLTSMQLVKQLLKVESAKFNFWCNLFTYNKENRVYREPWSLTS